MTPSAAPPSAPAAARRRPKNRKQQILTTAAALFWDLGYDHVAMADVARDVDIQPSALYRHFAGKRELLSAAMIHTLSAFEQAATEEPDDSLLDRLVTTAVGRREFGLLWERESGHLPAGDRRQIRLRLRAIKERIAALISAQHRISAGEADLKAWAVMSVLDSLSHHHVHLAPTVVTSLMREAVDEVIEAEISISVFRDQSPPGGSGTVQPTARREAVLASAMRLFGERGYAAVGMTDIGSDIGITGASVYNYFDSKADLLVTALNRGNEALWLGLHHALRSTSGPVDALGAVLADYTTFAARYPDVVGVLVSEVINLPDEHRDRLRRAQHEYVTEWVALRRASRDDLDEGEARVLVHAGLGVINSLTRIHHLRGDRALEANTARLAGAVLGVSTVDTR